MLCEININLLIILFEKLIKKKKPFKFKEHGFFLCCIKWSMSDNKNSEQQEPHLSKSAFGKSMIIIYIYLYSI